MATEWTQRRERFREVLAGDTCVHPGSVFDPMSARIAEAVGYEISMLAGSVASFGAIAAPDLVILTLTELAEQVRRVCRAGGLPLLVDADHGFGNALSVMRTTQELEHAGVSAFTIEDTVLPRPYGGGKTTLLSVEEGVGKMKAALSARDDSSLIVIGRTSAVGINGVEDAIMRAKAYEAAGVDALFFVGMKKKAELEAVKDATSVPIMLGHAADEMSDAAFLASQRVRIALQPHLPVKAAVQAVYATMKALRDGVDPAAVEGVASNEIMAIALAEADYKTWSKDFLAD